MYELRLIHVYKGEGERGIVSPVCVIDFLFLTSPPLFPPLFPLTPTEACLIGLTSLVSDEDETIVGMQPGGWGCILSDAYFIIIRRKQSCKANDWV